MLSAVIIPVAHIIPRNPQQGPFRTQAFVDSLDVTFAQTRNKTCSSPVAFPGPMRYVSPGA